jgi:hypothetical protein
MRLLISDKPVLAKDAIRMMNDQRLLQSLPRFSYAPQQDGN